MAKYEIEYACGHTGTVNLVGPNKDREEKLDWLKGKKCRECQIKEDMEKAMSDETPVEIRIKSTTHNVVGSSMHLIAVATGGTYREKEKLRELGFTWGELQFDVGLFDFLSVKEPKKCWNKIINITAKDFDSPEAIIRVCGVVDNKIGPYTAIFDISDLDVEFLKSGIEKRREEDAAAEAKEKRNKERINKIGKSPLQIFAESNGKFWNGKKYGSEKYGFRIYVDNEEYKVPADIMREQEAWYKHRDEVDAEYGVK